MAVIQIGKRQRMTRSERELQLLEVATGIFVGKGYQGATMEDISLAAKVSRPVVYSHFPTKDDAYLACLRKARRLLDKTTLGQIDPKVSPELQMRQGLNGYFDFVENYPSDWRLLYESGTAVAGVAAEEAKMLRQQTVAQLALLYRFAAPNASDLSIQVAANSFSGAAEQVAKWWLKNLSVSREDVVNSLLIIGWQGIQTLMKDTAE